MRSSRWPEDGGIEHNGLILPAQGLTSQEIEVPIVIARLAEDAVRQQERPMSYTPQKAYLSGPFHQCVEDS